RRSNLKGIDRDRPVDPQLVGELCRLATLAPNHRHTAPWRFTVFTGDGRRTLGAAFERGQRAKGVTDQIALDKALTKYTRAPVVVAVASVGDTDPVVCAENRDAVSAAVQTLLLAATAAGLASLWSTGAAVTDSEVRALCGLGEGDTLVAIVYLGWQTGEIPASDRSDPVIRTLDS
ncbi:MAG TPA: nitroreductase family protein, partial [Acidimicrobiales bacterium]